MSTDFNVVDDEEKTFWHLGQRMSTVYSFGFGSRDHEGAAKAAELVAGHLKIGKSLRIVLTDDIPEGYAELKKEK